MASCSSAPVLFPLPEDACPFAASGWLASRGRSDRSMRVLVRSVPVSLHMRYMGEG